MLNILPGSCESSRRQMQNKNSVKNWFSAKFTENINSGEQEMNLSNILSHERNMWVILDYKLCLSINNVESLGELKQSSPDSEPGVPNLSNSAGEGSLLLLLPRIALISYPVFIYLFIFNFMEAKALNHQVRGQWCVRLLWPEALCFLSFKFILFRLLDLGDSCGSLAGYSVIVWNLD